VPTIVTVHDLIKSHFTGRDTTTRAPWLYRIKRAGYNQVIKRTLTHALDIIVPSNTVKNDILAAFPTVKPELIHPIPEAPDEIFRSGSPRSTVHDLPSKYVLFVGNAYPHKNLGILLDAMQSFPDLSLVIVAKSTPFLERTLTSHPSNNFRVLANLPDSELVTVYRQAQMLVTPSLMEGYGLVGLEALMVGTPVVASNIPVYREVYGNRVTYFDPTSRHDLVSAIRATQSISRPSKHFIFDRTWDDVARGIAEVIHAGCARL
jgi:glycosyltransferase involved in cell wall biosynthesis